jgi:hypothetical protein
MWGIGHVTPPPPLHIRFSWCTTEQMDSVLGGFGMRENRSSKLVSFKSHEQPYKERATGGEGGEEEVPSFALTRFNNPPFLFPIKVQCINHMRVVTT